MTYNANRERVLPKKTMNELLRSNLLYLPKSTLEDLLKSLKYYLEHDKYDSLAEKQEWEATKITIERRSNCEALTRETQ